MHLFVLTHTVSVSVCVCLFVRDRTKSQKTPEDKEEEAADARKKEQALREENKESVNCTAAARKHSYNQASTVYTNRNTHTDKTTSDV